MNVIIAKLLSVLGWQKMLLMVWNASYPSMQKASAKTETEFDDNFLKVVNELIIVITGKDHPEISKPKELK